MITIDQVHRALGGEIGRDKNGRPCVRCPGPPPHSADDRSLSVTITDDGNDIVVYTFSPRDDVITCKDHVRRALGMPPWRPGDGKTRSGSGKANARWTIESIHDYPDESGQVLYQSIRYDKSSPQRFSQRRPDGNGGWIPSLGDVRRILYRLPELIEALGSNRPVFIVEGEKDVDTAWKLGVPATCNPMGAGKWRDEYSEYFKDAVVYIIPDEDESGHKHAKEVYASVSKVATEATIVRLPIAPNQGKDLTDWVDNAGGTVEHLYQLAEWAASNERLLKRNRGRLQDDLTKLKPEHREKINRWLKVLDQGSDQRANFERAVADINAIAKAEPEEHWPILDDAIGSMIWITGDIEEMLEILARVSDRIDSPASDDAANEKKILSVDDFYCYMPMTNAFIYIPTRDIWPASSVNARVPPIQLLDKDGKPLPDDKGKPRFISAGAWLASNRPVDQMTWAPGLPKLIQGKVMAEGGWIERNGSDVFNLYRPPTIKPGDASKAGQWIEHVRKVFPDDADHIIRYLAHRVQRPADKINHALVLGGKPGIGKDTILEPVKQAVGHWNFLEVSPQAMLSNFTGYLKSVVLRISEARDLGEINRYSFYEHMKAIIAAPPDTLRINEKHIREYSIPNATAIIMTTNHKTDGIYLPEDDRRHYIGWSDLEPSDFPERYWETIYQWYHHGGFEDVAAYLAALDLSGFDSKAPPKKTQAFWDIISAQSAPENSDLADVIAELGHPEILMISDLISKAQILCPDFAVWLADRKNRKAIAHRLEDCGYELVRSPDVKDGRWKRLGGWVTLYARSDRSHHDRLRAARRYVES